MRLQAPGCVDCHPFLVRREFVEKNLRHNEFDFSGRDEVLQGGDHRLLPIIFCEVQPPGGVDE